MEGRNTLLIKNIMATKQQQQIEKEQLKILKKLSDNYLHGHEVGLCYGPDSRIITCRDCLVTDYCPIKGIKRNKIAYELYKKLTFKPEQLEFDF